MSLKLNEELFHTSSAAANLVEEDLDLDYIPAQHENLKYILDGQEGMNRVDMIESFEELGWADPELTKKEAISKTVVWLGNLNFFQDIYPKLQVQAEKPPTCIFIPDKATLRKLIRAASRAKNRKDLC